MVTAKELPLQVIVSKHRCSKCNRNFYPKIDNDTGKVIIPKYCPYKDCHSINWNRPAKHYFIDGKNRIGKRVITRRKTTNKPKPKLTVLEQFRQKNQTNTANKIEQSV